ncbi:MAG: CPBP family intramembrane glutamic endopeptidase [Solirubrobacteraceae bacterium]
MAPAAVLMGAAGAVFGSLLVEIVGAAAGSPLSHPTPAVSLSADVISDLAFVAAALYYAVLRGGARPRDFGYRTVALPLGALAFLSAGIGYYIVTFLYGALFKLHGNDKLPSELGVNKSTAALIAAAVFVCVIAPVCEELFFRGFLFGVLRRMRLNVGGRNLGTAVAAIITGILFGFAHLGSAPLQYLIPLAFLGIVLCVVRWRTRSLYPCMALHSFNNCLALGVNQLGWNAAEIIGLSAAAFVVIAAITGPLALRDRGAVATA